MNPNFKKTFWGSIVVIFIGTSCCWMSAIAVWFGGSLIVGTIATYLENTQHFLIYVGIVLGMLGAFRFWQVRKG